MSAAWWGKEADRRQLPGLAADGLRPQLLPPTRKEVLDALKARTAGYTPEWTRRGPDDAGVALARLYSEQMETVLARLNRLPDKAKVDFLDMAGISPLPASPSRVLVQFEVAENAPQSVLVPEGFQSSARSDGELVIFETERTLYAAPAKIAELRVSARGTMRTLDQGEFVPFGEKGDGMLLIGLSDGAVPGPTISLYVEVAGTKDAPPPVSAGSIAPAPVSPLPLLQWEILDNGSARPAELILDESRSVSQSGVVELGVPRLWRSYPAAEGDKPLRWLRLRIVHGRYPSPPRVTAIRLNAVRAIAARAIFDEVLREVPGSEGRKWTVSQTPVLPQSLQLEVDEGGSEDAPVRVHWREIASLVDARADDKVYEFDPGSGTVSFGDGVHGEAAPRGFRHIHAVRYQVGGGKAGAVDAEAIANMVNAAPFLNAVKNPLPASGGQDEETQARAVERGPQELRARGRAVTVADYALLAQRAPGALVARAHAVAGLHPSFPGRPLPGVVAVFVVPADGPDHPLVPDPQTLAAVASYLAGAAAPAGVEIVAAAPRYHRVRVEAGIVLTAGANAGQTVSQVLSDLNAYLDPRTGAADGHGWPFGGALIYTDLLRRMTKVPGVHAVPHLNLVVDGGRVLACRDHAISPHGLLEAIGHEIVIAGREQA